VLLTTYLIYGCSEYNGSNDFMIVRLCLKRCVKNHGITENTTRIYSNFKGVTEGNALSKA
jgi:hypothetical protein